MSSGVRGLELLAQQRDNLLRAEIAGLLHDLGKFCELSAEHYSDGGTRKWFQRPKKKSRAYKAIVRNPKAVLSLTSVCDIGKLGLLEEVLEAGPTKLSDELQRIFPSSYLEIEEVLVSTCVEFSGVQFSLAHLIMLSMPGTANLAALSTCLGKDSWLAAALAICHAEAHYDKEEPRGGNQKWGDVFISDAFGWEESRLLNTDVRLAQIPLTEPTEYSALLRASREHFPHGLGDTRRPNNEVTLWDWSFSVASLYKAALATAILEKPSAITDRDDHELKWRLLRVGLNGLAFLEQAPTITDLLGRRAALQDGLNQVKQLLEVTYPLGNEIYRDENGSAFIIPALDADDARGSKLLGLLETPLLDAFRQSSLDGELVPSLRVSAASKQAEKLNELLQEHPPPVTAYADAMRSWWRGATADICTACGVRPQGWGTPDESYRRKAINRNVCYVCLERRGRRAQKWADGQGADDEQGADWKRTIWLDEVADRNGRLALLVGRFELKDWLNGEMVRTLLVKAPPNHASKNPSFARLRRVWETTDRFWKKVESEDLPIAVSENGCRLVITPDNRAELANKLGKYHVYDAEMGALRTSLVWDDARRVLLTADDLIRVASKLGLPKRYARDSVKAAEHVKTQLANCRLSLYEPGGYGQRREQRVEARLGANAARLADGAYAPMIPLLTEPATFMALVPADRALEAVRKISARFKREMGKVRNRLPFFLGTVFFDRRQPLFTALDAGRRMIGLALCEEQLTIAAMTAVGNDCELAFSNGLKWPIPVKMGDVSVPDEWYPYFHVIPDAGGNPPTGRTRQFEHAGKHWVHAESLAQNDQLSLYPARFAYLHLDTSARRFQTRQVKLWWLEEAEAMMGLWEEFKQKARTQPLTDTQLRGVETLFKTKLEQWQLEYPVSVSAATPEQQAFESLVEATLKQEGLSAVISKEQVLSGLFAATLELYFRIVKDRLAPERQTEGQPEEAQL